MGKGMVPQVQISTNSRSFIIFLYPTLSTIICSTEPLTTRRQSIASTRIFDGARVGYKVASVVTFKLIEQQEYFVIVKYFMVKYTKFENYKSNF
jgi:hypothetical protein